MSFRKTLTRDGDLMPEIKKPIALGWAPFSKVDNIMRNRRASMKIKRKILNEYVLPLMRDMGINQEANRCTRSSAEENGVDYAGHHPSRPQA